MFLNETKDSLEATLEQSGVKGMKWGVRKASSGVKSVHDFQKKHKKAIVITAAVVGAGAAAVILKNRGALPISSMGTRNLGPKLTVTNAHGTSHYGEEAVKAFQKHVWDKKVTSVLSDINSAHADQTRHMRDVFNAAGKTYNPRSNPFSPEARLLLPRGT